MGNPIDCIRLHAKDLFKDVKEDISRQEATDLALREYEKLHGELEAFKKSINPKYQKKEFVSPDKSQRIKEIEDEYAKNIEEINKEDERIKAEQKLQSEKPTTEDSKGAGKEPPKPPKEEKVGGEGDGMKELDKLANNVPDSGKVAEYMSKDTIKKYTDELPTNDKEGVCRNLK